MEESALETGSCPVCAAAELRAVYHGPIRHGRFGSLSGRAYRILRCASCDTGWLAEPPEVDYESTEYRELVDAGASAEGYHAVHDAEQAAKMAFVGTGGLRGKVIADVGCGAGSFLDLVAGFARATIAVEPNRSYRDALLSKGHHAFSYCSEVSETWLGHIDLAVCFSVLEHLDDPLGLLKDIRAMLRPGGELVLSTPNSDDWMLEALPGDYPPFFYRTVHRWYFSARSIQHLARLAGFSRCEVTFVHRYDLSNALVWLRDRKPSGLGRLAVSPIVSAAFSRWLEESGRSDYLYARLS